MLDEMLYVPDIEFVHPDNTEQVRSSLENAAVVVAAVPQLDAEGLEGLPYSAMLARRIAAEPDRDETRTHKPYLFHSCLPDATATDVIIFSSSPAGGHYELATELAEALKRCRKLAGRIAVVASRAAPELTRQVLRVLLAHAAPMPTFKASRQTRPRIERIDCVSEPFNCEHTRAASQGNAIARYLATLPKNSLDPSRYAELVRELAEQQNWQYTFMSKKKLASLGAGAFLAVARASDDAGVVHLRYRPAGTSADDSPALALVGKGVCYDTGGINVKPANGMFGMQEDMQGSSVALGTFYMLASQQVPYALDCWLALTENNIDARCFTPNEVVTAVNGVTIETVHTDAEGRMILADTLALASRTRPGIIMDYATLTGSSIGALGTRYASVFTRTPAWHAHLVDSGYRSGERVWPFPLTEDFDSYLESEIADVKQCCLGPNPDHINAARFLSRFVAEGCDWVHMDLSAGAHEGGLGGVPTEFTGFGVWFTDDFIKRVL